MPWCAPAPIFYSDPGYKPLGQPVLAAWPARPATVVGHIGVLYPAPAPAPQIAFPAPNPADIVSWQQPSYIAQWN